VCIVATTQQPTTIMKRFFSQQLLFVIMSCLWALQAPHVWAFTTHTMPTRTSTGGSSSSRRTVITTSMSALVEDASSSSSSTSNIVETNKIRNIAVIAHVDHGKTTLVDALIRYDFILWKECVCVCAWWAVLFYYDSIVFVFKNVWNKIVLSTVIFSIFFFISVTPAHHTHTAASCCPLSTITTTFYIIWWIWKTIGCLSRPGQGRWSRWARHGQWRSGKGTRNYYSG